MKTNKILLLLTILIICSCSGTSNVRKDSSNVDEWRYDIEAQDTGIQGTYLVKVWSYAEDPDVAINMAPKDAVHGILFKGFPRNKRIPGQDPLIRDTKTKTENAAYFSNFFADGGPYLQYVTLTNSGAILPGDRLKVGSGDNTMYKIGMVVSVNVADLRKHLEDDGIIEPLNAGF